MADVHAKYSDSKQKNARQITWLVMWMTTLGQAAITLYLPAFPKIAADLQINPLAVKTSITIFLLGYGFSQFIYGPLSDRYGRKPVLLAGLAIFGIGCMANIFVHTQTAFLLTRLIQGIGCGATITIGRSILRDCFSGRALAGATSYLSMGFAISLGISPIIGAYLQTYLGWRADFVFLMLISLALLFIFWRWLPETNPISRNDNYANTFNINQILKGYRLIIRDTHFIKFMLGGLFAYAVVVSYNVMTPFLIQNALGYSANVYGWLTVLIAAAYYSAATVNRKLALKFSSNHLYIWGTSLIILSGVVMALTFFNERISIIFIIAPMVVATFGQALIFSNTIAAALHHFPQKLGSRASAALSSLQMLLIGVLSAIIAIPANNSQLPLAIALILLGLLSGIILWPWKTAYTTVPKDCQ